MQYKKPNPLAQHGEAGLCLFTSATASARARARPMRRFLPKWLGREQCLRPSWRCMCLPPGLLVQRLHPPEPGSPERHWRRPQAPHGPVATNACSCACRCLCSGVPALAPGNCNNSLGTGPAQPSQPETQQLRKKMATRPREKGPTVRKKGQTPTLNWNQHVTYRNMP